MNGQHTDSSAIAVPPSSTSEPVDEKVTIVERSPPSVVQISAWRGTVSQVVSTIFELTGVDARVEASSSVEDAGTIVMSVGPGRYLIESAMSTCNAVLAAQLSPEVGTVVDLTHGRLCLRLCGNGAVRLLSKYIQIDLCPQTFPIHSVLQGAMQHVSVVLRRADDVTFDLYVHRSYCQWVRELLLDIDR